MNECSDRNTLKIEKIQERGLRLIFGFGDMSYSDMCKSAGVDLLYISRLKNLSMLVYRSVHEIGPKYLHDLFHMKENVYELKNETCVTQPRVDSTTYGLKSLRYHGSVVWNNLPNELKNCVSEIEFKSLLRTWDGPSCQCGFCILCKINL